MTMNKSTKEPGKIELHIRSRVISGVLVIIPLWITYLVLKMLFHAMASLLVPILDDLPFLNKIPDQVLALIAVMIFLVGVYIIGVITAFMIGRRLVAVGERMIMRIPVVKSIYSAAKQVVDTFSITDKEQFKSVVLLEFPRPGLYVIGFVTGMLTDSTGRKLFKVFVPHAPNPTGGFLELMAEDQLIHTNLSVEEGIKMIVSAGVISPETIHILNSSPAVGGTAA
jgi:uncharacterized membrane protein